MLELKNISFSVESENGKKQILKNIQKDRKTTSDKEAKDNYFKFITTLAILLIVFISAYFAIGFFYTKEISFNKDTKTVVKYTSERSKEGTTKITNVSDMSARGIVAKGISASSVIVDGVNLSQYYEVFGPVPSFFPLAKRF